MTDGDAGDGSAGPAPTGTPAGRRPQRARDPQARRDALAAAALEIVAEVGIGRVTHRAVAARAGLPLGATTYYFPSREALIAAGLRQAAETLRADLASWAERLRVAPDLAPALAALAGEYLSDRRRARIEYELYLAAARDPQLRPLAEAWLTGLAEVLEPYVGTAGARDLVAVLDGIVLQALVTDRDVDVPALTTTLRRLLEP